MHGFLESDFDCAPAYVLDREGSCDVHVSGRVMRDAVTCVRVVTEQAVKYRVYQMNGQRLSFSLVASVWVQFTRST